LSPSIARVARDDEAVQMNLDFVVPTVEDALVVIADGATSSGSTVEQAGLSSSAAEAELARAVGG
jgi:hypothetical protein